MAALNNRVKEKLTKKYGSVDKIPPQDTLSEIVGLSQTTVSRWLSNKIDRFDGKALEKWARFLDCRSWELIYMDGEEESLP